MTIRKVSFFIRKKVVKTGKALPQYQKAVEKSRATEAMAYAEAWLTGQQLYHMANGSFASLGQSAIMGGAMGMFRGAIGIKMQKILKTNYAPLEKAGRSLYQ